MIFYFILTIISLILAYKHFRIANNFIYKKKLNLHFTHREKHQLSLTFNIFLFRFAENNFLSSQR